MFWIAGGGPLVMAFLKLFADPLPPWLARQFNHPEWVGFTAWDMIMPLFMFVVGVAMPFSIGKRLARGDRRASIYGKVLWSSGWSLLLLALFYGVIDVLGCKRLAFPLTVIGMNAILAYMAPRFVNFGDISNRMFGGLATHLGGFGPLLLAFGKVGSLWVALCYLYRKRTFIRI
jgi:predicted acyltransferase